MLLADDDNYYDSVDIQLNIKSVSTENFVLFVCSLFILFLFFVCFSFFACFVVVVWLGFYLILILFCF